MGISLIKYTDIVIKKGFNHRFAISLDHVAAMKLSIKTRATCPDLEDGLICPLLIGNLTKEEQQEYGGARYFIVDGHHKFLAIGELIQENFFKADKKIRCDLQKCDREDEFLLTSLSANVLSKRASLAEIGKLLLRVRGLDPKKNDNKYLSEVSGISTQNIYNWTEAYIVANRAGDKYVQAYHNGDLKMTDLLQNKNLYNESLHKVLDTYIMRRTGSYVPPEQLGSGGGTKTGPRFNTNPQAEPTPPSPSIREKAHSKSGTSGTQTPPKQAPYPPPADYTPPPSSPPPTTPPGFTAKPRQEPPANEPFTVGDIVEIVKENLDEVEVIGLIETLRAETSPKMNVHKMISVIGLNASNSWSNQEVEELLEYLLTSSEFLPEKFRNLERSSEMAAV